MLIVIHVFYFISYACIIRASGHTIASNETHSFRIRHTRVAASQWSIESAYYARRLLLVAIIDIIGRGVRNPPCRDREFVLQKNKESTARNRSAERGQEIFDESRRWKNRLKNFLNNFDEKRTIVWRYEKSLICRTGSELRQCVLCNMYVCFLFFFFLFPICYLRPSFFYLPPTSRDSGPGPRSRAFLSPAHDG